MGATHGAVGEYAPRQGVNESRADTVARSLESFYNTDPTSADLYTASMFGKYASHVTSV